MLYRTLSDQTISATSHARQLGVDAMGAYHFHRPTPPSRLVQYGNCSTRVSS